MDIKNINNYFNVQANNNEKEINKPKLIEPGVKYFFNGILNECNKIKRKNYNLYYNISMFFLFSLILGTILITKYKGNKTKAEIYQKNLKDKEYIMSKLVYYNRQNIENNQRIRNNMITNLPDYSNHPEASLLHKKIYF
jgi:hypothetical protein